MKEKKVIDYTRTYRRIEADKKKCILYIVILLLLGFLLMWTQIDDLTRIICKICAGVLKKYEPHMYVGIRSETYPLFGKISYLSEKMKRRLLLLIKLRTENFTTTLLTGCFLKRNQSVRYGLLGLQKICSIEL